jgi:hypothetical protein
MKLMYHTVNNSPYMIHCNQKYKTAEMLVKEKENDDAILRFYKTKENSRSMKGHF